MQTHSIKTDSAYCDTDNGAVAAQQLTNVPCDSETTDGLLDCIAVL